MSATLPADPEGPARDDAIVSQVRGGDIEAFREIVERHQAPIWRFVRNFVGMHASYEDVAQEVFLAAFTNLASFDPAQGRFSTWLFVIAKNKCLNARAKMRPYQVGAPGPNQVESELNQVEVAELNLVEVAERLGPATPHDDLVRGEIRARLDRALDALPEDQRTAFVLEELVGLSTETIAEVECVAPSTIRSRLSRAKARLRAELASYLGETS